jgi:hypothetical protein
MGSILHSIALLFALLSVVASSEPKAQLLFVDNDALLKLDYATYRGYYNSTNEVASSSSYPTSR